MSDEAHVAVSAHVPVSVRTELVKRAREGDRTFSAEVRRGLAYYLERAYERDERETAAWA
jgi:hypothetical protein